MTEITKLKKLLRLVTDEWNAAADDHDDDKRLEPFVIDQFMREAAKRPPLLTGARRQLQLLLQLLTYLITYSLTTCDRRSLSSPPASTRTSSASSWDSSRPEDSSRPGNWQESPSLRSLHLHRHTSTSQSSTIYWLRHIYRVGQKMAQCFYTPITSSNINRFSKFFHC